MLGAISSEKGVGSLQITIQPERDSDGNITPESSDRTLQFLNIVRNYQDSFPTIIPESLFRGCLKTFGAPHDIRNILENL